MRAVNVGVVVGETRMALTVVLLSTIVSPRVNECALLSRPPWLETEDVLRLQLRAAAST